MRRAHGHTRAGVALGGQSPWWLLGACWSACADSRRRSGARCDTLFECNQSAPFDRVSNRYWKPEELCAGMTGAYLRQAASQRPSGMHCIAENRVMREVDCRGCLRLEYSLNSPAFTTHQFWFYHFTEKVVDVVKQVSKIVFLTIGLSSAGLQKRTRGFCTPSSALTY
jgi:hypothetical protein